MRWLFIFLVVASLASCQKPFNPDPVNTNDTAAIFTLRSLANNCSLVVPAGIYSEKKILDSLNKITVDVNVTKTGSWAASTNTINGIAFQGSGIFNILGNQSIILQGSGTPLLKGSNSFIITAGNKCSFTLLIGGDSLSTLNKDPVANAGTDTSYSLPANNVFLTGQGKDIDGSIVSFEWKKISGPFSFKIENPNSSITAVTQFEAGAYKFELSVIDNLGAIAKDTVSITITPEINKGLLFMQQELDAINPVNDTMNYATNKIGSITSNYHLRRQIFYDNNRISKIDYWYQDNNGDSVKALIHTFSYDAAGNVIQIFETQISINTTFLHDEFIYNNDNTLHERKTHFLGGRILRDNIFLYTNGNLTTFINLTPDNMGPPDTSYVTYDSRINNFNKISPQYYFLDAQSDYYLSFSSEIFYFSKNYPVKFGLSSIEVTTDPLTQNPFEIRLNNILVLRYIYY